jgi:hypothetical protein
MFSVESFLLSFLTIYLKRKIIIFVINFRVAKTINGSLRGVIPVVYIRLIGRELYSQ